MGAPADTVLPWNRQPSMLQVIAFTHYRGVEGTIVERMRDLALGSPHAPGSPLRRGLGPARQPRKGAALIFLKMPGAWRKLAWAGRGDCFVLAMGIGGSGARSLPTSARSPARRGVGHASPATTPTPTSYTDGVPCRHPMPTSYADVQCRRPMPTGRWLSSWRSFLKARPALVRALEAAGIHHARPALFALHAPLWRQRPRRGERP